MAGAGFPPVGRIGLLIAAVVIAIDQATKLVIVHVVMDPPRVIEVTPFFNIVLVWNRGVSFGLFSAQSSWTRWLLSGLAILITAALLVWLSRAEMRLTAAALGLVIGGAMGNVIDRLFYPQQAVTDFLDFHAAGYHWPAFNVADSSITIGVALLLIDSLIASRRPPKVAAGDAGNQGANHKQE